MYIVFLKVKDSILNIDSIKIFTEVYRSLIFSYMRDLLITQYYRILNYIDPDFVHVFVDGRIVEEGGPELAHRLEAEGYEAFIPEPVGGGES